MARGTGTQSPGKPSETDQLRYAQLLKNIDLFSGLERVTLARLAARLTPYHFETGSVIFREGDPGDALYLIASGRIGVYVAKGEQAQQCIKTLDAGEPFGELALFTNKPRSATMIAEDDAWVLRLERSVFLDLVRQEPSVAIGVASILSERLDQSLYGARSSLAEVQPPDRSGIAERDGGGPRPRRKIKFSLRFSRRGLAAAFGIGILAVGLLVPSPLGLSDAAWHALIILLAALPAVALDALPEGVLALLLCAAWIVFGVAEPAIVLSGFASESWVLVVAVLLVGGAVAATGVFFRLALATVTHIRGGFVGEVVALAATGLLMGPAVPNATSRIIIISPLVNELSEALGYPPRSRAAAGLAMTVLIAYGQMAAVFLTSSTTAVLVAALLPSEIDWILWALFAAPMNLIMLVGIVATILWFYRPKPGDARKTEERAASLALQRALLGRVSGKEKIALVGCVGMLAGFVTQHLHGIHPAWIAVITAGFLAAAGVVTPSVLRTINWSFAILFGVLVSLAEIFNQTRLDHWLTGQIAPVVADFTGSPTLFLIALALLCFAVSFLVRWQAAAPLITIALVPIAMSAGIDPFIVGLVAVIACNGFFVAYQSTTYLALSAGTNGQLFSHAQALPTAIAYGVWTLIAVVLSVPIWRSMQLL